MGTSMKSFGSPLIIAYLSVGSILSFAVGMSYLYATYFLIWHFGWAIFSFSGVSAIVISLGTLVVSTILRVLFWLPSLIIWLYGDQDNFWLWLAPGFFVSVGP